MDTIFIPSIKPALKHPTVFEKFDSLQPGEAFMIVNDHDPIPLFYELQAEREAGFDWNKLENGPVEWKVEIRKKGAAQPVKEPQVLDVTQLEPRMKHPTIFRLFDNLQPGETLIIHNDHDPKPLYYQLIAERGNIFQWTYLEKGPEDWKVAIRRNDTEAGESIGELAAKDIRKAEVFKKYGIDFCCGGKKSLKQACEEAGADLALVQAELSKPAGTTTSSNDFTGWTPSFLADYIFNQHHQYYYRQQPVIADLLEKVVNRHGSHFPELITLMGLYKELVGELNTHFYKEEKVLFPFIRSFQTATETAPAKSVDNLSLREPVQMMEADHEMAGEILAGINKLTNNYTPPANACNSFQFLYAKLKELQDDLHIHIHLENNILFPKALAMEKEFRHS